MSKWSLGRLDFNLPEQFKLIGRNQSIYHVEVETIPLQGKSAQEIWEQRIKEVQTKHLSAGYALDTFKIVEISPGFSAVFYKKDLLRPIYNNVEAFKSVPGGILKMKYTGKAGKEDVNLSLLSITADGYRSDIANGFNIGAGALISQPSVNEHAAAGFQDNKTHIEFDVELNTAGPRLSKGPLEDIDDEIKGLGAEGIKLRVLHRRARQAAGFSGEQALVEIKNSEESKFRYTWFYAGETANSFKPDIRIKCSGSTEYLEEATTVWNLFIDSMKMRNQ